LNDCGPTPRLIQISPEVAAAVVDGRGVVALESSVISQGLPRPHNLETALACESAVRETGAIPATTAVINGTVKVGLTQPELQRLALEDGIVKAGTRDLAYAAIMGVSAATTVGATIALANMSGIRVMATGGIGGVHRGYENHGDVSHDLTQLTTSPVIVVSAGFKSILDLPRTLEWLETLGVSVYGFQTEQLPNFYSAYSGFSVPRLDTFQSVADAYLAGIEFNPGHGMVVTNPPPPSLAFTPSELDEIVNRALIESESAGVTGKQVTPDLLRRIGESSAGRSIELNKRLLIANALLAGDVAQSLATAGCG
jgi:pseudouridine-5'-phosphate glycosidase